MDPSASAENDAQVDEWEEENDLGYYEDGVKRTLTDGQIEMFRHSELEQLRKDEERGMGTKGTDVSTPTADSDHATEHQHSTTSKAKNAKKRWNNKGNKGPNVEPKPDLRKRTWDVVEAGLDTLDYD